MGTHKTCQKGGAENHGQRIVVYHGDNEEYVSFMTAEAYHLLERWIEYRHDCGEKINDDTWLMRQAVELFWGVTTMNLISTFETAQNIQTPPSVTTSSVRRKGPVATSTKQMAGYFTKLGIENEISRPEKTGHVLH